MIKFIKRLFKNRKKLNQLFSVGASFNEGYKKGWMEATAEARKEIAKNYHLNER